MFVLRLHNKRNTSKCGEEGGKVKRILVRSSRGIPHLVPEELGFVQFMLCVHTRFWHLTLAMTRESGVDQPVKAGRPNSLAGDDDGRWPTLELNHRLRGRRGQSEKP